MAMTAFCLAPSPMVPCRHGAGLMGSLVQAAERAGVTVLTEAHVTALFAQGDSITGVRLQRPDGTQEDIACDALILACNGYGGNPAMVRQYIPEIADATYAGHTGNQGDAVLWGQALGAQIADMGAYAPTIGIIGTVMGLVKVLSNLGAPAELGKEIASAFVATLWGVMSANVFWLPIGTRLKRLSAVECQQMELVIEGILAIQSGYNPRLVEQKLNSLLPASLQPAQKDAA